MARAFFDMGEFLSIQKHKFYNARKCLFPPPPSLVLTLSLSFYTLPRSKHVCKLCLAHAPEHTHMLSHVLSAIKTWCTVLPSLVCVVARFSRMMKRVLMILSPGRNVLSFLHGLAQNC